MNISSVWFYSQHPAPTSLCCRAAWTHFAYTELEGPRNSYLSPGPPMLNQWLLVQGYKYSSSLASTWKTEAGLTLSPELPCGTEPKCHPRLHTFWWMGFAWHHTLVWAFLPSLCVSPLSLFSYHVFFPPQFKQILTSGNRTYDKVCLTTHDVFHFLLARKAVRFTLIPPKLQKATIMIQLSLPGHAWTWLFFLWYEWTVTLLFSK